MGADVTRLLLPVGPLLRRLLAAAVRFEADDGRTSVEAHFYTNKYRSNMYRAREDRCKQFSRWFVGSYPRIVVFKRAETNTGRHF